MWARLIPVVRSIADTADADMAVVTRLVIGLTEPLRQLDDLWRLPTRADSGAMHPDGEIVAALRVLEPPRRAMLGAAIAPPVRPLRVTWT